MSRLTMPDPMRCEPDGIPSIVQRIVWDMMGYQFKVLFFDGQERRWDGSAVDMGLMQLAPTMEQSIAIYLLAEESWSGESSHLTNRLH